MKYLKLFDTESAYKAYRDGGGYIQPNVSLSIDPNNIHYNLNANGHPYVDLGLPSGTLWAKCNVGASEASEAGLYFQWGDTQGYTAEQVGTGEGQKKFASDWSDYKWRLSGDSWSSIVFKKYTTKGAKLELEDDAAHVNMGGDWHMPTPTQIQELLDNTTTAWTTSDSVSGLTFTSKKDTSKSIFFPAAGEPTDGSVFDSGDVGIVWSSVLNTNDVNEGQELFFVSEDAVLGSGCAPRFSGVSVRGVIG